MLSNSFFITASSSSVMFWKGVRLIPKSKPSSFIMRLPHTILPRYLAITFITSWA